ncbi:MAG: SGNH/GDSL hydrolase family protein [Phycisphaerae bacterium]|nr:SGNH/GDSL hydrolase family protein [Phycisphaerae bacterium]
MPYDPTTTNRPDPTPLSRRHLFQGAVAVGGALAASHLGAESAAAAAPAAKVRPDSVILLQGDSITDAGRDKRRPGANDPRALGAGYAGMIATRLLGKFSGHALKCYNRGISGNKVPDLDRRWQTDCIDLKPDVLSILIGVNDIWHKLNGRYPGTVKDYEDGFAALLARTTKALPKTTIVICEPFVLRCGAVGDKWFPEFDQRRAAAKRVAGSAGVIWVPFQSMFDDALSDKTPPNYWAGDGVHPTMAGHALMAETWMDTVFGS